MCILHKSLQARRGNLVSEGTTAVFWLHLETLGLLTLPLGDRALSRVRRFGKAEGALEVLDTLFTSSFFDVVRTSLSLAANHVAEGDVAALDM